MPSLVDAVGYTSAGVLGYIVGGTKGAKSSVDAFNSYQNSMKRKAADAVVVTTKRVKATTTTPKWKKKKSGGYKNTRLPASTKRTLKTMKRFAKKVYKQNRALNKRIRKVAIKAIHGEDPTGKYIKQVMYNLPNSIGGSNSLVQTVVDTALYQGGTTHDGQMCVGSYPKLIDALSILWGSKAAGWYVDTGNISSVGMIVPYIRHRADYEFVNNTLVTQVLLFYSCCTKEDTNNSVYTNWAAMTVTQKGGTTRGITYAGMRPEYYPQFRDHYNYEKFEYRLAPGARFTFSLDTGAKTHVDFDKWAPVGGGACFSYRKHFTKELLVINWNAVTVGFGETAAARPAIVNQVAGDAPYTIGVQMNDYITSTIPENLSTTNNNNNTLCVWNRYDQNISVGQANTVTAPAITQVAPYQ